MHCSMNKGNKGSKMLGLGPNPFSYLLAGLYLPKRSIFKFQWKCRATARKKSPKIMDLGIFRHFNISETILTKLKKIEIFNKIRPFICLYLGTFILFLTIFKKIEENVPIFDRNRSILIEFLSILTISSKSKSLIKYFNKYLSKSKISLQNWDNFGVKERKNVEINKIISFFLVQITHF